MTHFRIAYATAVLLATPLGAAIVPPAPPPPICLRDGATGLPMPQGARGVCVASTGERRVFVQRSDEGLLIAWPESGPGETSRPQTDRGTSTSVRRDPVWSSVPRAFSTSRAGHRVRLPRRREPRIAGTRRVRRCGHRTRQPRRRRGRPHALPYRGAGGGVGDVLGRRAFRADQLDRCARNAGPAGDLCRRLRSHRAELRGRMCRASRTPPPHARSLRTPTG